MKLQLITPAKQLAELEVREVIVPGLLGYMGFLPGHAPLFAQLGPGEVEYRGLTGGGRYFIHGGFVEVKPEEVIVLADAAESSESLTSESARGLLTQAEARLASATPEQLAEAQASVTLARARVTAAERS